VNYVNKRLGKLQWQSLQERDSTLRRWNCFPNIDVKAAYLPLEQVVNLGAIGAQQFDDCFANDAWADRIEVLPVLMHEVRHWFDHIGTVWGQSMLVKAFNAMNAREEDNPTLFSEIVSFWRAQSRDQSEDYFFVVTDDAPSDTPRWIQQFSKGNRFDERGRIRKDRPLMFANFYWEDGRKACRTPLSILSLLETNAMFYELETESQIIAGIPDGEREIERGLRTRQRAKDLANPYLAQYSAVAHLVANALDLYEPLATYTQASRLAALCLNLPGRLFAKIKVAPRFAEFRTSMTYMRVARDPVFAFLCILYADEERGDVSGVDWLTNRIQKAGLPPVESIRVETETQMAQIAKNLRAGPFSKRADSLLELGRSVFGASGLLHAKIIPLDDANAPIVILRNRKIRKATGSSNVDSEAANWPDISFRLMNQMEEFISVCGT
jgi:hypothetical protein